MNTTGLIQVEKAEPITNMMLVSEINQKFPQCRPVFEKYGIAGCGGEFGPPEPLFIFAAAHHVPVKQLVTELNAALRGEWKDDSRPQKKSDNSADAETLYKRFVAGALLVALTMGMTLGVINITRIALGQSYYSIGGAIKQAHGHAQLFGWVALMIMGVAFHAVPRFKMTTLPSVAAAKAAFGMMLGGVLLRSVAQPLADHIIAAVALVMSGLLELGAVGIFAWTIGKILRNKEQPREFFEKFLWAGVGWFVALACCNVLATFRMVAQHTTAIDALEDTLFIHVALFGFISNMIFGFSMRVVPHFMGLRDTKVWMANAAFWLWNGAIFLRYPHDVLAWIASGMETVAAILFVWSLGIFAKRRVKMEIQGVDGAFAWFLYLGYGWLLIAAALPFHADIFRLTASARHAMTIGFITSMMLGVAHRVLPVFNGVNLYSSRLLHVTFVLQALGSTLPLAMAVAPVYEQPWAWAWAGATGYFVLGAVMIAAWNLGMTLRAKVAAFTRDSLVMLNSRVADILDVWPDLRPVMIHNGLPGLAKMRGNPPRFVTVEFAARRHGIEPQPLIDLLNNEIRKKKA